MQRTVLWIGLAATGLFLPLAARAEEPQELGFRLPEGFRVRLFAGDELAHDIFSMTIDHQGHVVVAGRGYVKRLLDTDGDGRADRAVLLSPQPGSGAHGLYVDARALHFTGDNVVGRLPWASGGQRVKGPVQVWTRLRHPEHGANGLLRGPDGSFYVICGNDAGVTAEHAAAPRSPVQQPENGAIVRLDEPMSVLAHGFRNPYDAAFTLHGALLLVDADGERDHHLPWYAPNRLFDVVPGAHHGWVLRGWRRSWNRPAWYWDTAPRSWEIGRGSPTGAVVYRHTQFPPRYHGGFFSCCWTLGRVYFFPLEIQGAEYRTRQEVFLQTTGHTGLAPVDLAVGPRGELYVAVGGRGTRGSVFCIQYRGADSRRAVGPQQPPSPGTAREKLLAVLQAPQPLAAWSRARWRPLAQQLGPHAFVEAIFDPRLGERERIRAVEVLGECFQLQGELRQRLAQSGQRLPPVVKARVAWALGRWEPHSAWAIEHLIAWAAEDNPWVARWAWQALLVCDAQVARRHGLHPPWLAGVLSPHRRVWLQALLVARAWGVERLPKAPSPREQLAVELAEGFLHFWHHPQPDPRRLERLLALWPRCTSRRQRLQLVRLIQLAWGDLDPQPQQPDVFAGYTLRWRNRLPGELRRRTVAVFQAAFPTGQQGVDYELARTIGALQEPASEFLDRLSKLWTPGSSPVDDVHWLICAARVPGEHSEAFRRRVVRMLLALHEKMRRRGLHPSRNWPLRVGEAVQELLRHDPQLAQELIQSQAFRRPEHAMFALLLPKEHQPQAARALLGRWPEADDPESWTAEMVLLAARLPGKEAARHLRPLAQVPALRDLVVLQLAHRPAEADRALLLAALGSPQPEVVQAAAEALARLAPRADAPATGAALEALRQAAPYRELAGVQKALDRLLRRWAATSGSSAAAVPENKTPPDGKALYQAWVGWATRRWPELKQRLRRTTGVDVAAWQARLRRIRWDSGDPRHGERLFEQLRCHLCHRGSRRLGPDLAGAAQRFSPVDLMMAIADPSREVAPLYRTRMVLTRNGQVFHGLVVYESPNGTLLQTGPETTVRFTADEVEQMVPSQRSLMPEGLLRQASDQDLADLYAYLRTLQRR